MTRSIKKGPFVDPKLMKKVLKAKLVQTVIKNYELIKLNPNSLYSYQLNISNIQIWHKIAKKIGMKKFMESMKNEK